MSLLWCGGEDICFSPLAYSSNIGATGRGAPWTRGGVYVNYQNAGTRFYSVPKFSGGAVTSFWFSCRVIWGTFVKAGCYYIYLGQSGTDKGYGFGTAAASKTKLALYKFDGSASVVTTESGNTIIDAMTVQHLTVHVQNYGSSCNIDVYHDDVAVINWSGDATISGVTGFDEVVLYTNTDDYATYFSELMVNTEDNSDYSLCTQYLTGDGDANAWGGDGWDGIDDWQVSEGDSIYTDTDAEDFQGALQDTPTGAYSCTGLMVYARGKKSVDAAVGTLKLGVKSGGTVDVDAGQAITTSSASYARLMTTINGSSITDTVLDAMQLDLRSGT